MLEFVFLSHLSEYQELVESDCALDKLQHATGWLKRDKIADEHGLAAECLGHAFPLLLAIRLYDQWVTDRSRARFFVTDFARILPKS